MSMNNQGRPTAPVAAPTETPATFTGNRALMLEEPLIFEIGSVDRTGVDFEEPPLPFRGEGRGEGDVGRR